MSMCIWCIFKSVSLWTNQRCRLGSTPACIKVSVHLYFLYNLLQAFSYVYLNKMLYWFSAVPSFPQVWNNFSWNRKRICKGPRWDVPVLMVKVTLERHLTGPSICCLVIIHPFYLTPWWMSEMAITTRLRCLLFWFEWLSITNLMYRLITQRCERCHNSLSLPFSPPLPIINVTPWTIYLFHPLNTLMSAGSNNVAASSHGIELVVLLLFFSSYDYKKKKTEAICISLCLVLCVSEEMKCNHECLCHIKLPKGNKNEKSLDGLWIFRFRRIVIFFCFNV